MLTVALLTALVGGGALYRLRQGPVTIPGAAEVVERMLQAQVREGRVGVERIVLALGDGEMPTGIRMEGVTVEGRAGETLLAVPSLAASVAFTDLVRGEVAPSEITVRDAHGKLYRDAEGRFSLAFGGGDAGAEDGNAARTSDAFIAALTGEADIPALAELQFVEFTGLRLDYDDAISGRSWSAEDSFLSIERDGDGAVVALFVRLMREDGVITSVALEGDRRQGATATDMRVVFRNAATDDAADQLAALDVLRGVDAPISGAFDLRLGDDGLLQAFAGQLRIGKGEIQQVAPTPIAVERAIADFTYDVVARRFDISRLDVATDRASARMDGWIERHPEAAPPTARLGAAPPTVVQLNLSDVVIGQNGLFAGPVTFAGGAVAARILHDPLKIEIGSLFLTTDDLKIHVGGTAEAEPEGWRVALDLGAEDITLREILALWPPDAARGARSWAERNMDPETRLTRLSGGVRLVPGERAQFSSDFAFSNAQAQYLPAMPPIRDGSGIGELTDRQFSITLQDATVTPEARDAIAIANATFIIEDIRAFPAQADVRLNGEGRVPDVLALIDYPPLNFLSRLNLTPDLADGRAEVSARLRFPTLRGLTTADVETQVSAELYDVTSDSIARGRDLRAERLSLAGDNRRLVLSGAAELDGVPLDLRWEQRFGSAPASLVVADVTLRQETLAAFGIALPEGVLDGAAPGTVEIDLRSRPIRFAATTDLTPADVTIAPLGWSKAPGQPGTLTIEGTLGAQPVLESVALAAEDLALTGVVEMGGDGRVSALNLSQIEVGEWLASSGRVDIRQDPARFDISLTDGRIDLRRLPTNFARPPARPSDGEGDAARPELHLNLALDEIALADGVRLTSAGGTIVQNADGRRGRVRGRINEGTPVAIDLAGTADQIALSLSAEDAGSFLRDAGVFETGHDGALTLDISQVGRGVYEGELRITDITIKDTPVLAEMLQIASVVGVLDSLSTGGLTFNSIVAPFVLHPDRFELQPARATGVSMGITMEGDYVPGEARMNMRGVVSPAYLLNGILSGVPVLGDILTRREGEGIFGFTYSLRGPTEAPRVRVNPLSILAPGVLRGVMAGGDVQSDEADAVEAERAEQSRDR
ncbi:MAG: AsmA-like C-terminal region-containing protein [Pseudomonadota bacterium]